jgi:hypothetical protein
MERSAIRELISQAATAPDYAALHPGYNVGLPAMTDKSTDE